jgi:hypothetical protein
MNHLLYGTIASILFVIILYTITGWDKIISCYKMWLDKKYWTSYNIVEAVSWFTKAIIIVPGLVFGIEIWYFYFLALITSCLLIWASNKKLLPTLVGFNSLWVWISCVVLAKNLVPLF